jgi:allantoate deiminase
MARADELAALSEESGAITRPYGTPSLVAAVAAARGWLEAAGMSVRADAIGNLVGRYEGTGPGTLLLGSHIDSVRNAGRYDGPLGVLVAIAAVEALHAGGTRLPFAVEVVVFVDEEGLRYHAGYIGSRVVAGLFDPAELETVDRAGVPLRDAVLAQGGDPDGLAAARWQRDDLIGYLEVHIEQGPVLEALDLPVGVVTSIAGQSRGTVTFVGRAGHAGTTPIELRRDALCAAAEFVLAVEVAARSGTGIVATVGMASVEPGVGNVIPGRVRLSFDIRHTDDAQKAAAVAALTERAHAIGARRGIEVAWETIQEHDSCPFDERLVATLGRAVEATGRGPGHLMPSGAGHDAVSMAHLTGVSMLFVRCAGGVSHHPDESVTAADVTAAVEVVQAFLVELARGA